MHKAGVRRECGHAGCRCNVTVGSGFPYLRTGPDRQGLFVRALVFPLCRKSR